MMPTSADSISSSNESSLQHFRWKASRFTHSTEDKDGALLLYSSFVGALARIGAADKTVVRKALDEGFVGAPKGPLAELTLNGFFVANDVDELALATALRKRQVEKTDVLELALMPTEKCNFRCVYCYEAFLRGKMPRNVIDGIVEHVRRRSATLAALHVGWFGGEPLMASDVISEVATRLQGICRESGTNYSSSMVTNGYLLTPEIADLLFDAEVRNFQITLDGGAEDHDRLRVLADRKSGTFSQIYSNLLQLKARSDIFRVVIRLNFDPESVKRMQPFLDRIGNEFANDDRFFVDFHPVGRWGGSNDGNVEVCGIEDGRLLRNRLFSLAADKGLNLRALRQRLEPFGSVCYAANPHSFVIGSDGTIYKCTVAFDDPRNHVGQITSNGDLQIDPEKFALWVGSGEEKDHVCQTCFFRPACQGNACPLERIRTGHQPCPSTKTEIDETIRVIAGDAVNRASHASVASSSGFVQISPR